MPRRVLHRFVAPLLAVLLTAASVLLAAAPASARPSRPVVPTAQVSEAGIALGHWRNRPNDSGSWTQKQTAAETQFGSFEGHWRNFKPANSNGALNSAETAALANGKRLFINWKPCTSWETAAAGNCDAAIVAAAQDWTGKCTTPDACWVTFWHEPENDLTSGNTIAEHKAMFQHVAPLWRQHAPNVKIAWTMMGFSGHRAKYSQLWPGAEHVDLIGHNPYIGPSSNPANLAAAVIDNATWLRQNLPGAADKPVVATEWGASLSSNKGTTAHKAAAIDGITARLAEVVAAGHIELDMFDASGNSISCANLSCADAQAYKRLKDATEG